MSELFIIKDWILDFWIPLGLAFVIIGLVIYIARNYKEKKNAK